MSYKLGNEPDRFKMKDDGSPIDFHKVLQGMPLQKDFGVKDSEETEGSATKLVHTCNKMWDEHNDHKKDPWRLIGIIGCVIIIGVGLMVWFW